MNTITYLRLFPVRITFTQFGVPHHTILSETLHIILSSVLIMLMFTFRNHREKTGLHEYVQENCEMSKLGNYKCGNPFVPQFFNICLIYYRLIRLTSASPFQTFK